MGDFFFPADDSWRDRVLAVMEKYSNHVFLILTKRSKEMVGYFKSRAVPANVWVGVTVESSEYYSRVNDLLSIKTENRWISMEPLLGTWTEKQLSRVIKPGIKWVIVGGETGRAARPADVSSISKIYTLCREQKIPYFFKKYKGKDYTKIETLQDGDFRIFRLRQFPAGMKEVIPEKTNKIQQMDLF